MARCRASARAPKRKRGRIEKRGWRSSEQTNHEHKQGHRHRRRRRLALAAPRRAPRRPGRSFIDITHRRASRRVASRVAFFSRTKSIDQLSTAHDCMSVTRRAAQPQIHPPAPLCSEERRGERRGALRLLARRYRATNSKCIVAAANRTPPILCSGMSVLCCRYLEAATSARRTARRSIAHVSGEERVESSRREAGDNTKKRCTSTVHLRDERRRDGRDGTVERRAVQNRTEQNRSVLRTAHRHRDD